MYKLNNGLLPEEFSNIFPQLVGSTNNYNLRNADNFITVQRRTTLFSNSFIPSATALWNTLPLEFRQSESVSSFKYKLKTTLYKQNKVPDYFFIGNRSLSVFHARLRNGCSNLNGDLFANHLRLSGLCQCEREMEDAEHYFFKCRLYTEQRIILFHATRPYHPLNLRTLLFGNNLSSEDNVIIFKSVQKYIKDTGRLTDSAFCFACML